MTKSSAKSKAFSQPKTKSEIRNSKSETNSNFKNLENQKPKADKVANDKNPSIYDLEDRTYEFAKAVRAMVRLLPHTLSNIEDARQLVNASGSVGANYIEANEALSKKDFAMRIKICRKEAKESRYWLRLLYTAEKQDLDASLASLIREGTELTSIFGAIVRKTEGGV
jgi:four helix bundle protein